MSGDGISKLIQCRELESQLIPSYDLLVANKGLGRTTQLYWFCVVIFFFLISEMSQNVYLVNLFSGEVGKHKLSECDQHGQPERQAGLQG